MTTSRPEVPLNFCPNGTVPLETQVAGHKFEPATNSIGVLKNTLDTTILKPLGKPQCGIREVQFYESIKNASESDLVPLKKLVPQYFGTVKMVINGRELDFIKLKDLTFGIYEPCIMDIKVGKRTWDPLATPEKKKAEEEKYAVCKQNLGLCIPGFQVYNIFTGKLRRFGRDYGKSLNVDTFTDALKIYLNAEFGMSRTLIYQILCQLWSIQKWSRTQTSLKLYSSSILLIYDAKRLKSYLQGSTKDCNNSNSSIPLQIGNNTPSDVYMKSMFNQWTSESYKKLPKDDVTQNNVDDESRAVHVNNMFLNTNFIAVSDDWVRVKMIDFAHAFPSDDNTIDTNYLFGIEHLVTIFEHFFKESNYA